MSGAATSAPGTPLNSSIFPGTAIMTTIANAAQPNASGGGQAAARGRLSFSVRTSLLVILSLFIVGLFALAVANLYSAWTSMNSAQTMRSNNEVGDIFLSAAGSLAAERGVTNAALASPMPADARVTAQIVRLREEADLALQSALDKVRAGSDFTGKDALVGRVRKDADALAAMRHEVDRQLAQLGTARDAATIQRWVPTATALVVSSQELRVAAQVVPSTALARTQILLDLKQAMWVMSEYAGRERATVGALVGRGGRIDPALPLSSPPRGRGASRGLRGLRSASRAFPRHSASPSRAGAATGRWASSSGWAHPRVRSMNSTTRSTSRRARRSPTTRRARCTDPIPVPTVGEAASRRASHRRGSVAARVTIPSTSGPRSPRGTPAAWSAPARALEIIWGRSTVQATRASASRGSIQVVRIPRLRQKAAARSCPSRAARSGKAWGASSA